MVDQGEAERGTGARAATAAAAEDAVVGAAAVAAAITRHFAQLQRRMDEATAAAWAEEDPYSSWLVKHGSPREVAAKLVQDPVARLTPLHR